METKNRSFDAVVESRLWKEAVGQETAGMTPAGLAVYFDKAAVLAQLTEIRRRGKESAACTLE
jgi:hypothetical protein